MEGGAGGEMTDVKLGAGKGLKEDSEFRGWSESRLKWYPTL